MKTEIHRYAKRVLQTARILSSTLSLTKRKGHSQSAGKRSVFGPKEDEVAWDESGASQFAVSTNIVNQLRSIR
jgi:hypothetical protein